MFTKIRNIQDRANQCLLPGLSPTKKKPKPNKKQQKQNKTRNPKNPPKNSVSCSKSH